MTSANKGGSLTAEIVNLRLAARSFKEAANEMRAQRDEARLEAVTLRRHMRIAAVVAILILLLVAVIALWSDAIVDGTVAPLEHLLKVNRGAAETTALQSAPGTVLNTQLTLDEGYLVYEVAVADKDGTMFEISVDAVTGKILQRESVVFNSSWFDDGP